MKRKSKDRGTRSNCSRNPEGFTVDAKTLQPVTSGYAVAVKATQNSFNTEGLALVVDYAATDSEVTAFGGWLDSETGLFYYDAVIIVETLEECVDKLQCVKIS